MPALAGESAPAGTLELILNTVESLGPSGPIVFVLIVALFESIPLFPTQPLSLASGLLFGTQKGALCVLLGTIAAALISFTLARGVGRPLAERLIAYELEGGEEGGSAGVVQAKIKAVEEVIANGSSMQQAVAVLALRLTPIVPFR
jgi:uncharacterized membrane protein YdjX (TVP38/TMEM64 family)